MTGETAGAGSGSAARGGVVIEMPLPPPPPKVPDPSRHAKAFVGALAAVILLGAALLATPWATESGEATAPVDALFTAVSAVAVTGLVTVDTATHWNLLGEAVVLILIQIGGLGFMVGASVVLLALRRGHAGLADALLAKEGGAALTLREAAALSRRIVAFTFAVEAAGAVVLAIRFARDMPLGEAVWAGLFHAVSAFCNAGFDLMGGFASLSAYRDSITVNAAVILLIQSGALSYIVLADVAARRRWGPLALDTKLVLIANAVLLAAGTIVFLAAEWNWSLAGTPEAFRPLAALFQSVAARTAGFATVDFAEVQSVTLFFWMALMLVGGASGSTAGGVKLATIGVVAVAVFSTLRGQEEPQLFGRRIPTSLVFRAMAVIAVMLAVHFAATALLAAVESLAGSGGFAFLALMFEAMSALATVGLSTGITPDLSAASKLVLCATMFFGRLGPLTVAYALQTRQQRVRHRYPEAPVRIG
jgi:trk system potassium uptake protein